MLDKEQIAEQIIDEILKRLDYLKKPESKPPGPLVIIDGLNFYQKEDILRLVGEIHKRDGVAGIIYIDDDGLCDEIKRRYDFFVAKADSIGNKIFKLVESCESIFVLNLTISNASKICNLYDEGLVPKTFQYALMTGRNVFVSDICSGFSCSRINSAYLQKLKCLAKMITDLGIKCISEKTKQKSELLTEGFQAKGDEMPLKARKVICLEDISNSSAGTIEIGRNTIITPLAMEYIRDKKILVTTI